MTTQDRATDAPAAGDMSSSLTHHGTAGLSFINADYTLTLSRLPEGPYIGLAALTHYSHAGVATVWPRSSTSSARSAAAWRPR